MVQYVVFFWLLFSLFTLLAWLGVCSLDVGKVELWMTCNTSSLTMWSLRGSGFPGGLGSMMCFFRKLLSSSKSYWNKYKFFQPHIMEVPKSCVYFFSTWHDSELAWKWARFLFGCYFCCSLQSDIRRPEVRIHEAYRRQWCMGDWYLEAVWTPRSLEPSKLMIVDARSEKFREMGS